MQSTASIQMTEPEIISSIGDDDSLTVLMSVPPELIWFQGHFPGTPVLPGVVQLHWAVEASREKFGFENAPLEILRLKFKNIISPPMNLTMKLTRTRENEVQFDFSSTDLLHSEGRIRYGEPA